MARNDRPQTGLPRGVVIRLSVPFSLLDPIVDGRRLWNKTPQVACQQMKAVFPRPVPLPTKGT